MAWIVNNTTVMEFFLAGLVLGIIGKITFPKFVNKFGIFWYTRYDPLGKVGLAQHEQSFFGHVPIEIRGIIQNTEERSVVFNA